MQTFLPHPDFHESAKALDYRRLGKQRVEALQILNVLTGATTSKGWQNHPAVLMWKGYERSLVAYAVAICEVWTSKGYKDTVAEKVRGLEQTYLADKPLVQPMWIGQEDFHLSHRSNLVRKLPSHYGSLWPDVPNDLPYFWPEGESNV